MHQDFDKTQYSTDDVQSEKLPLTGSNDLIVSNKNKRVEQDSKYYSRMKLLKSEIITGFSKMFESPNKESSNDHRELEEFSVHSVFQIIPDEEEEIVAAGVHYIQNESFWKLYAKKAKIGEGTTGSVYRCIRRKDKQLFAVKVVRTRDEEITQQLINEFINISRLSSPHIVKVHELYIDKYGAKVFSVMEFIKGQEMFSYIAESGSYFEENAKLLFIQLLQGIRYLHESGVVHRDLKPNNILVYDKGKKLKITDFNVAKFFEEEYKQSAHRISTSYQMYTYTGTLAFSAPEVLQTKEYSEKVDIWSAGCVLYTMLSGIQPFYHRYVNNLAEMIQTGSYPPMKGGIWENISLEAKHLVASLIVLDPADRMSAESAILHPWFNNQYNTKELVDSIIPNLSTNLTSLLRGKSLEDNFIEDNLNNLEVETPIVQARPNDWSRMLKNLTRRKRSSSILITSNINNRTPPQCKTPSI